MFSHQSPIGPCVGGNPGVRSARDNVASVLGRVTTPRGSVATASPKAVGSQGCEARLTQVNRRLTVVMSNMPKGLTGMNQKVRSPVGAPRCCSRADIALPADRRSLHLAGVVSVRNVVSPNGPTGNVESDPQGSSVPVGVEDAGESERRPVIGRMGVSTSPHPKGRPLPAGLGSRERSAGAGSDQANRLFSLP